MVEYKVPASIPNPEDDWKGSPGMVVDKGLIAELIEEGEELLGENISGEEA